MTYWLNIDYANSRATIHAEDCVFCLPRSKRNGFWQEYPTWRAAARDARLQLLGVVRYCAVCRPDWE